MSGIQVGDTIIVEITRHRYSGDNRPPETKTGTVSKVARKYFTVHFSETRTDFSGNPRTYESDDQYEIGTGFQRGDPNYPQYRDRAYTPAAYEAELFRRDVMKKIRQDHKAYGDSAGTMRLSEWTDGELVELLGLLDRVKERQSQVDLDR